MDLSSDYSYQVFKRVCHFNCQVTLECYTCFTTEGLILNHLQPQESTAEKTLLGLKNKNGRVQRRDR